MLSQFSLFGLGVVDIYKSQKPVTDSLILPYSISKVDCMGVGGCVERTGRGDGAALGVYYYKSNQEKKQSWSQYSTIYCKLSTGVLRHPDWKTAGGEHCCLRSCCGSLCPLHHRRQEKEEETSVLIITSDSDGPYFFPPCQWLSTRSRPGSPTTCHHMPPPPVLTGEPGLRLRTVRLLTVTQSSLSHHQEGPEGRLRILVLGELVPPCGHVAGARMLPGACVSLERQLNRV